MKSAVALSPTESKTLVWSKQDSHWVFSLFGTAVGAGILFLPINLGNAYSFCPLTMKLAVCLSYMVFITLKPVLSIPTMLRVFYHKWVLDFIK